MHSTSFLIFKTIAIDLLYNNNFRSYTHGLCHIMSPIHRGTRSVLHKGQLGIASIIYKIMILMMERYLKMQ